MTQTDRLLAYLRANPGASSIVITYDLYIVNVTGRISDLREAGHVIDAVRGPDRVFRYYLREPAAQLALAL
jgi:hypothetical protein